jgi:hypothetical protein
MYESKLDRFLRLSKLRSTVVASHNEGDNKRSREEHETCEFQSTLATKKALLELIKDDDFVGVIKIDVSYLKDAILKLSDEDVIALKPELKDMPGTDIVIERAELRMQNALLRKYVKEHP